MKHLLTDEEWAATHGTLGCTVGNAGARAAAQAGLYKLNHRHSAIYRTFNWQALPCELGLAGVTANRYFVGWSRSRQWLAFWDALIELRYGPVATPARVAPQTEDPIRNALDEIGRAYAFFNRRFMGGELPETVVFTIEKSSAKPAMCGQTLGAYSEHYWGTSAASHGQSFHHIALMTSALQGSQFALGVLLHEMTHLRNWMQGIEDTNTRTQYHTQDFRDVAVLFGLQCATRDPTKGYHKTSLAQRGLDAIRLLDARDESLRMQWIAPDGKSKQGALQKQ